MEPLEDRRVLSFTPPVDYPVGTQPTAIVSADFNADGRLDLATANYGTHDVSVLLGNADGSFQSAQNFAASNGPLSIATGDFNADGKLDLATANNFDVSVLLGNGDGSFQPSANINIGTLPSSVAIGDFNADGKLDLGVSSNNYYPGSWGYYGWYPGYYVGRANVLLGNGDGGFSAPSVTPLGYGYHDCATLADYNADGKLDFAAVTTDYGSAVVMLGDGTGALSVAGAFATGTYPRSVAAGDINGDGNVDLVAANPYYGNVGVLLGTGLGSFGSAQNYAAGNFPVSVAMADLNADGYLDLVTASSSDGTVSVLLGDGAGAFKPPATSSAGAGAKGVALGDFNGDGRSDAATPNADSGTLSVLLNDGIWPALDVPSIAISDAAAVLEGNVGTVSAVFTVSLSAAYGQTVTVGYSTLDGTARLADGDYQAAAATLTFAPGQTTNTITVLVNGDRLGESEEGFLVRLSDADNAFVIDPTGQGTIADDEPLISIAQYLSAPEGNVGATPIAVTVELSSMYDAPVTVDYSTSELTDDWIWGYGYYTATAGVDFDSALDTLTFAPGETSKSITVMVQGDRFAEPDEHFLVNLANPTSAKLNYTQSLVQIVDDEPIVFFVNNYEEMTEGDIGTAPLNFSIGLSAVYDAPVTVVFTTFDNGATAGDDYLAVETEVTFPAGQTTIDVPVTILGDQLAEGYDERFYVQLSNANSATILNPSSFGVILDDDTTPALSISDVSRQEGNTGTTRFVFTVTLSTAATSAVTVHYATANGTATKNDNDYAAKNGKLTFAPGETSRTVTISVKGDKKKEADESFFVNLSRAVGAEIDDGRGEGQILNDDNSRKGFDWLSFASSLDDILDDLFSFGRKKR